MCESFYKCRVGQRALIQSNDTPVFHHGAESVWVIILTSYCCGHITIISLPKSVRVNKAPYSIRYSSLNVRVRWWLCSQQLTWRYVVLITFQFTYQCNRKREALVKSWCVLVGPVLASRMKSVIKDSIAQMFCLCYKAHNGCWLWQPKLYRLFRIVNRNRHLKSLPKAGKSAMQDRHS